MTVPGRKDGGACETDGGLLFCPRHIAACQLHVHSRHTYQWILSQKPGQIELKGHCFSFHNAGDASARCSVEEAVCSGPASSIDATYAESEEFQLRLRRGLTFAEGDESYSSSSQKGRAWEGARVGQPPQITNPVIIRRGFAKFFEVDPEVLGSGEWRAGSHSRESALAKSTLQLRNRVLSASKGSGGQGDALSLFSVTKLNGGNAQVSWFEEKSCWVCSSKNVSLLVRSPHDLALYEEGGSAYAPRFAFPRCIAAEWFRLIERLDPLQTRTLKAMLSRHTMVGELVGERSYQHLIRYNDRELIWYGCVPHCPSNPEAESDPGFGWTPEQLSYFLRNTLRSGDFKIAPSERLGQGLNADGIFNLIRHQMVETIFRKNEEGIVLYITSEGVGGNLNSQSLLGLVKCKAFEYRLLRLIRSKCLRFVTERPQEPPEALLKLWEGAYVRQCTAYVPHYLCVRRRDLAAMLKGSTAFFRKCLQFILEEPRITYDFVNFHTLDFFDCVRARSLPPPESSPDLIGIPRMNIHILAPPLAFGAEVQETLVRELDLVEKTPIPLPSCLADAATVTLTHDPVIFARRVLKYQPPSPQMSALSLEALLGAKPSASGSEPCAAVQTVAIIWGYSADAFENQAFRLTQPEGVPRPAAPPAQFVWLPTRRFMEVTTLERLRTFGLGVADAECSQIGENDVSINSASEAEDRWKGINEEAKKFTLLPPWRQRLLARTWVEMTSALISQCRDHIVEVGGANENSASAVHEKWRKTRRGVILLLENDCPPSSAESFRATSSWKTLLGVVEACMCAQLEAPTPPVTPETVTQKMPKDLDRTREEFLRRLYGSSGSVQRGEAAAAAAVVTPTESAKIHVPRELVRQVFHATFVFPVGLPGSGKSSIFDALLQQHAGRALTTADLEKPLLIFYKSSHGGLLGGRPAAIALGEDSPWDVIIRMSADNYTRSTLIEIGATKTVTQPTFERARRTGVQRQQKDLENFMENKSRQLLTTTLSRAASEETLFMVPGRLTSEERAGIYTRLLVILDKNHPPPSGVAKTTSAFRFASSRLRQFAELVLARAALPACLRSQVPSTGETVWCLLGHAVKCSVEAFVLPRPDAPLPKGGGGGAEMSIPWTPSTLLKLLLRSYLRRDHATIESGTTKSIELCLHFLLLFKDWLSLASTAPYDQQPDEYFMGPTLHDSPEEQACESRLSQVEEVQSAVEKFLKSPVVAFTKSPHLDECASRITAVLEGFLKDRAESPSSDVASEIANTAYQLNLKMLQGREPRRPIFSYVDVSATAIDWARLLHVRKKRIPLRLEDVTINTRSPMHITLHYFPGQPGGDRSPLASLLLTRTRECMALGTHFHFWIEGLVYVENTAVIARVGYAPESTVRLLCLPTQILHVTIATSPETHPVISNNVLSTIKLLEASPEAQKWSQEYLRPEADDEPYVTYYHVLRQLTIPDFRDAADHSLSSDSAKDNEKGKVRCVVEYWGHARHQLGGPVRLFDQGGEVMSQPSKNREKNKVTLP